MWLFAWPLNQRKPSLSALQTVHRQLKRPDKGRNSSPANSQLHPVSQDPVYNRETVLAKIAFFFPETISEFFDVFFLIPIRRNVRPSEVIKHMRIMVREGSCH